MKRYLLHSWFPSRAYLKLFVNSNLHKDLAQLAAEFWPGPLTLILPSTSGLDKLFLWDESGTDGTIIIRIPEHDFARELLHRTGPLATTSASAAGIEIQSEELDSNLLKEIAVVVIDRASDRPVRSSIVAVDDSGVFHLARVGAISLDKLRQSVPESQWIVDG